jgi:hypothetical protein
MLPLFLWLALPLCSLHKAEVATLALQQVCYELYKGGSCLGFQQGLFSEVSKVASTA